MAENVRTDAARRKRVQRLKKTIILLLIASILIPMIMCIVLFVRVNSLEKQIGSLTELVEESRAAYEAQMAVKAAQDRQQPDQSMQDEETTQSGPKNSDGTAEEPIKKKVYLTFDDGPSIYTREIMDILEAYNVKGTFFVVGREDEKSLALYQEIVDRGHTLGMHSYSHKYSDIYSSTENFRADIQKLQDLLYETTGVKSLYYRFPGGSSNQVSKTDIQDLIACLEESGITHYDWNISSGDAVRRGLSAEQIVDNCLEKAGTYASSMILMHDAGSKATTVEALPTIIEQILDMEDTVILPITEDTVPIQHVTKKIEEGTEE